MSYCSVFDSTAFQNCLEDLNISELLTLKRSLKGLDGREELDKNHYKKELHTKCTKKADEICERPTTLALVGERRGYEETHPSYEPWQPEEKPSKLQTLFQISVTALAFLSFGGYLLCLIVQSIKSKGTTFFHPVTSTMATTNGMKRIKIYRRSRRSSLPPIESTHVHDVFNINDPYHYYESKYRNVGYSS